MIRRLILPLKMHGQKGVIYPMSYNSVFTLNKYLIYTIKYNYKLAILDQLILMPQIKDPVKFTFIFHKKDNTGYDLDNWGFCQSKILLDAMQNKPGTLSKPNKNYVAYLDQILPEDCNKIVKGISYLEGEIDKEHPHCECIIEEVKR